MINNNPVCAVCGNPATCCVADNPAVSATVGFPLTGDMTTFRSTQSYTNYCHEHTPAWWQATSTTQEQIIAQLRSALEDARGDLALLERCLKTATGKAAAALEFVHVVANMPDSRGVYGMRVVRDMRDQARALLAPTPGASAAASAAASEEVTGNDRGNMQLPDDICPKCFGAGGFLHRIEDDKPVETISNCLACGGTGRRKP